GRRRSRVRARAARAHAPARGGRVRRGDGLLRPAQLRLLHRLRRHARRPAVPRAGAALPRRRPRPGVRATAAGDGDPRRRLGARGVRAAARLDAEPAASADDLGRPRPLPVAVMFGAAALAFGAALAARGWSVDAIRARPARSAAFALAVVAAMLALARIATKPIEVRTAIAASTAAAFPGDEVDFVVTVTNETGTFLPNAAVVISLPQGMTLLGRPTQERGPGCTGTTTVTCDLDFLEAHMVTRVHLGVRIDPSASSKLRVRAFGKSGDVAGPTSTASVIAGAG